MKKFDKRFLKEVLGLNEEEIKLVMECQRLFPELLDNEAKEINSFKQLYDGLGLNRTEWSRWRKRNIDDNEFFLEDKDWKRFVFTPNRGGKDEMDYIVSTEFAKHLCMMARTENSHKFRQYFITIEKAIRGKQEHLEIREPEKENYNRMKEAIIKDYESKHDNVTEYDRNYLMIRESNMLNVSLTGLKANEIRTKLGYKDVQTREHLQIEINTVLNELEIMIIGLVYAGVDFDKRQEIIKGICDNKYSHLKMI